MMPSDRLASVVVVVVGVLLAGGCGGPTNSVSSPSPSIASPRPALPPRPEELPLAGVNPCDLLTESQYRKLGATGGLFDRSSGESPTAGDGCLWTNFPDKPDNQWGASTLLSTGAEYSLGLEPLRSVDGFAATTAGSAGTDRNFFCGMLIDVAPHQALMVTYANNQHDYPGMTHQMACDKAQQVAGLMIPNLRAIRHR
jgi:hypothetical protein